MSRFRHIVAIAILISSFTACNSGKPEASSSSRPALSPVSMLKDDPFKNSMVESEFFDLDTKADNTVEGKNGTILFFPKGCFKNKKGKTVEENVKIEIKEALSTSDMLLSNLTTMADGKLLASGGMMYFNATANGEPLTVSKENPVHIDIPTPERRAGMMAYKGIRDAAGNMNWVDPKNIDNYLTPVDISLLDFLPEKFKAEVALGMPFRSHKYATQELTDSLYYSLSEYSVFRFYTAEELPAMNEALYSGHRRIVNGKYTPESYERMRITDSGYVAASVEIEEGIDPAIIKVIHSKKYQNTLISTREFESRLKTIFKTCNNAVLDVYTNHLDKNLYELDSMAAALTKGTPDISSVFSDFAKQRLTKVKTDGKAAANLTKYYDRELKKVKAELEKTREKYERYLEKKEKQAEKIADDYKELLWKREKYRMETYGFEWTDTGWVNVDVPVTPKRKARIKMNLPAFHSTVTNGSSVDRIYNYIVYQDIKSIERFNTSDNTLFYRGELEDSVSLTLVEFPATVKAMCVAIGYKNDQPYFGMKEFIMGQDYNVTYDIAPSTMAAIRQKLEPFEKYKKENSITKDLEYMAIFEKENQRRRQLQKEDEFMRKLYDIAHQCIRGSITRTLPKQVPAAPRRK
jgi:hypothetical protein